MSQLCNQQRFWHHMVGEKIRLQKYNKVTPWLLPFQVAMSGAKKIHSSAENATVYVGFFMFCTGLQAGMGQRKCGVYSLYILCRSQPVKVLVGRQLLDLLALHNFYDLVAGLAMRQRLHNHVRHLHK